MTTEDDKTIADTIYNSAMDGVVRGLTDDQLKAFHELLTSSAPQVIGARDALWRLGHAIARAVEEKEFERRQQGENAAAVSRILNHGKVS